MELDFSISNIDEKEQKKGQVMELDETGLNKEFALNDKFDKSENSVSSVSNSEESITNLI